jgi:hypothetical protein
MLDYKQLKVPEGSSWDKKPWHRRLLHWRVREFIVGVKNIIRWFPTVWKDRDWDDYYITKLLQKKIEFQREYLVKHNRYVGIERDNFWMTVVLNLIEREHEEYYGLEKYNYQKSNMEFILIDNSESFELNFNIEWEKLDDYLAKYPATIRKVKKQHPDKDFTDKHTLALYVGTYNQERCRNLIFEILKRYSAYWWD